MWQYMDYSLELYHHGILGQKWGIRRYQNADGTLTPAGRKRYRVDSEGNLVKKTKDERKADSIAAKAKKEEEFRQNRLKREQEDAENKKQRVINSRDPQLIYENKDLFTYQELTDLYNIMQREKQIRDMIPKGETFMDKLNRTSDNLGDLASAVDNGTKFYNSVAKVSNSLLNTSLPKIEDSPGESRKEKKRKEAAKEAEYYKNLYLIEQNKENISNLKEERLKKEQEKDNQAKQAKQIKEAAKEEAKQKKEEQIKQIKENVDKNKQVVKERYDVFENEEMKKSQERLRKQAEAMKAKEDKKRTEKLDKEYEKQQEKEAIKAFKEELKKEEKEKKKNK